MFLILLLFYELKALHVITPIKVTQFAKCVRMLACISEVVELKIKATVAWSFVELQLFKLHFRRREAVELAINYSPREQPVSVAVRQVSLVQLMNR